MKNFKKIICLLFILCLSLTAFMACDSSYKWGPVSDESGMTSNGSIVGDNGGMAIQKGDYIYFINGFDSYDQEGLQDNVFGNVIKGAICRRPINDTDNEYVKVIVPQVFVANYFEGGFYIFGSKIFYTTSNTERGSDGKIQYSILDFMMVNLDGTGAKRITKLDGTSEIPFKFIESAGSVYLVYQKANADGENSLYKINTSGTKETLIAENITGYAFGDSEVFYTQNVKKTNRAGEEIDEYERFNKVFSADPAGDPVEITDELNEGSSTQNAYSSLSFQKGVLFFSRDYSFGGNSMNDGICGYNTEDGAIKSFTRNFYTTFILVSWGDGLIVYNNGLMTRYLNKDTSFPMYRISSATLYFISGGYLYYGIDEYASGASGAIIWRLQIPNTVVDEYTDKKDTQQITQNAVHNGWLKPKLVGGRIYYINLSNATNDDGEYVDTYYEEDGYRFYTFYVVVDDTPAAKEDIVEYWIGMHDESEKKED